jgi:hypothetical protein
VSLRQQLTANECLNLECGLFCDVTEGACTTGLKQSPVDITTSATTNPLTVDFEVNYPTGVPAFKAEDKVLRPGALHIAPPPSFCKATAPPSRF